MSKGIYHIIRCTDVIAGSILIAREIVGYVDGKEMSVKKVRDIEAERKKAAVKLFNVKIIPAGGEVDGVAMNGIKQQAAGKDVARQDGGLIVGPFNNKSQAIALVEFVEVMGYGDAKIEQIENNQ